MLNLHWHAGNSAAVPNSGSVSLESGSPAPANRSMGQSFHRLKLFTCDELSLKTVDVEETWMLALTHLVRSHGHTERPLTQELSLMAFFLMPLSVTL